MKISHQNMRPVAALVAVVALVLSLSWSAVPVMAALPTAPIVTSPLTGASTSSSPVRIYGTAELGTEVFVSGGATPASGVTDAAGNWSALVNLTANSENNLAFIAKDAMGSSSLTAYITINHSASVSGTTTPPAATTTPPVATTTPATDLTAPDAPVITAPLSPHSTSTSPIRFSGIAEADATIVVTGGWITSTTTASGTGEWNTFLNLFADTEHTVYVRAIDAAGNVSADTTFTITHTSTSTLPVSTTTPPVATTTPTTSTSTPTASTTTTSDASLTVRSRGGSSGDYRYPVGAPVLTNSIPNMSPIWLESSVLFPQIMVLGVSTKANVSLLFTSNLRLGSRGSEVTALQVRLKEAGYFKGPVTGYYGVMTRAAVRAFQKDFGVSTTGNVGPKTRAMLNS